MVSGDSPHFTPGTLFPPSGRPSSPRTPVSLLRLGPGGAPVRRPTAPPASPPPPVAPLRLVPPPLLRPEPLVQLLVQATGPSGGGGGGRRTRGGRGGGPGSGGGGCDGSGVGVRRRKG
ncbi:hypothetical protein J437_LFUL007694 [Ladona fulva]|uniref:Uncharacterized protein n=1 Tax=Ladona fulva TaxID=123851 RepID=A0A8K0K1J6_LADFU|nr:hypothetical protein J437_LFUL007694 [Ladona fulva]